MSSFLIRNIQSLKNNLQTGNYLAILGVGKIPPHIALLTSGTIHSLKVNGYKQESIEELLAVYKRKGLACLFLELKVNLQGVETNFASYKKASENITCLLPIKDSLVELNTDSVNYVFDLIEVLEMSNVIKNTYHINLDSKLRDSNYAFEKYNSEDINNRIEKLQKNL